MMRLATCICALTVGAAYVLGSCSAIFFQNSIPLAMSGKSAHKTDVLTVFLTGNEFGTLKPCGCAGGQLGGLDRRSAVFNSVPDSKRLIIDTGSFVDGDSEQDLIKFNIIIQALSLLDYDLVNLNKKDAEIAEGLGLLDSMGSVFNVIGFQSGAEAGMQAKFTKQLSLKETNVAVTVAAFDAESAAIKHVRKLFATSSNLQTVNILILNHCDTAIIGSIARMGIVDCLVCPAESDEPEIINDPNESPLVISVGRYGKYVGKLEVSFTGTWNKKLSFSTVPVSEDLPLESSLVELYRTYQQLVKEENLLEKQPRFALPNGLEYVGSKSCKLCHEYEYEKWSSKAHAHAYATLERVGSQYDPECVVCHVIGMEYESGFVSEDKTSNLKNVGCENCHGPGSEHIRTLGVAETIEPKSDCTDCHTVENSPNYTDNEQLYFEKIIHWREPNAASDVKK
jgi:hypothetical protein